MCGARKIARGLISVSDLCVWSAISGFRVVALSYLGRFFVLLIPEGLSQAEVLIKVPLDEMPPI